LLHWLFCCALSGSAQKSLNIEHNSNKPLNVIFILCDDHRYDFMGFTGKVPWLKTPNMDKMAHDGVWIKNATVTTSLCSPSRASILTGMYAHKHTVVDNNSPMPPNLIFLSAVFAAGGLPNCVFWQVAYWRSG